MGLLLPQERPTKNDVLADVDSENYKFIRDPYRINPKYKNLIEHNFSESSASVRLKAPRLNSPGPSSVSKLKLDKSKYRVQRNQSASQQFRALAEAPQKPLRGDSHKDQEREFTKPEPKVEFKEKIKLIEKLTKNYYSRKSSECSGRSDSVPNRDLRVHWPSRNSMMNPST